MIVKCDEWERRSSAEGYNARGGEAACANSDAHRRDADGERQTEAEGYEETEGGMEGREWK